MKLLLFDDYQLGVLNKDGNVVNVSQEVENFDKMPPNLRVVEVINNWSKYQPKFNNCIENNSGTDISGHKIFFAGLRPPTANFATSYLSKKKFQSADLTGWE